MDIDYKYLQENLPDLQTALAVEALFAARFVAAEPQTARGGPWSMQKLTADHLCEVQTVASFRSLKSLFLYAEANRGGRVDKHLKDLRFSAEGDGTPVRGGFVKQHKRSGKPGTSGNTCRKRAVKEGNLKCGSREHKEAHRGLAPEEHRHSEYLRAKARKEETLPSCKRCLRQCADSRWETKAKTN